MMTAKEMILDSILSLTELRRQGVLRDRLDEACTVLWTDIGKLTSKTEQIACATAAIKADMHGCKAAVKVLSDINPEVRNSKALRAIASQQSMHRLRVQLARPRGALIAELLEDSHKLASILNDMTAYLAPTVEPFEESDGTPPQG